MTRLVFKFWHLFCEKKYRFNRKLKDNEINSILGKIKNYARILKMQQITLLPKYIN